MKDYQERTGRKMIRGTKKLLEVTKAKRILLYTQMLKWYLSHGLKVTLIDKYKSGKPFSWFPEEVSKARCNGDNDSVLKQLGDTYKLKGNSFYGKMIEDLMKHQRKMFMTNEDLVDKAFRSPFFEDLKEINGTFEIKESNRRVNIMRPYQCGIVVYQPTKLRILEFYYDFLDKYLDRRDFELIQMDTNSMYMAISGNLIDEIIRLKLQEEYDNGGKAEFLLALKSQNRTPGLFKAEFQGTRMIALMSEC